MSKPDLFALLDRPIAYHRIFVALTGSVTAAIMLSQAVYWQRRARQKDGFWYKTTEEWEEETGLTRHQQDTARKACQRYLKTDLRDAPARLYWRVDQDALYADLVSTKPAIQFDGKRQTGNAESGKQDSRKAANINRYAETTTETTTETTAAAAAALASVSIPEERAVNYETYALKWGNPDASENQELLRLEQIYPSSWIGGAIDDASATRRDLRRPLRYVETILKRWAAEDHESAMPANKIDVSAEAPKQRRPKDTRTVEEKMAPWLTGNNARASQ